MEYLITKNGKPELQASYFGPGGMLYEEPATRFKTLGEIPGWVWVRAARTNETSVDEAMALFTRQGSLRVSFRGW